MARDLKFAMCHTNKSIKKSQDFRNFDLDSSLQIVPPKERRFFGENFELSKRQILPILYHKIKKHFV